MSDKVRVVGHRNPADAVDAVELSNGDLVGVGSEGSYSAEDRERLAQFFVLEGPRGKVLAADDDNPARAPQADGAGGSNVREQSDDNDDK